ncbi:MAG: hypothetical protein EOS75_32965, partial [Mesorhizobium sp.]
DLTLGLEPEDGVIWVYGANDDDGILAFTDEGIEEVKLLLEEYHRVSPSKACPQHRGAQVLMAAGYARLRSSPDG